MSGAPGKRLSPVMSLTKFSVQIGSCASDSCRVPGKREREHAGALTRMFIVAAMR